MPTANGEVPVSVVRGRRDSVASGSSSAPRVSDERERLVEESLAEKAGREHAERRLAEAQITIKALQTRLGHAELERDEVVSELKRLRDQLSAAERADSERARAADMRRERPPLKMSDEGGVLSEPEPVKWWL